MGMCSLALPHNMTYVKRNISLACLLIVFLVFFSIHHYTFPFLPYIAFFLFPPPPLSLSPERRKKIEKREWAGSVQHLPPRPRPFSATCVCAPENSVTPVGEDHLGYISHTVDVDVDMDSKAQGHGTVE